jgi:hypothetical protein
MIWPLFKAENGAVLGLPLLDLHLKSLGATFLI